MQNVNRELRIEPLEARIAPATILLRSHDAVVMKAGQLVDVGDDAMAAWAGSDLALPVKAGDVLVFDADDDGRYEPAAGEFVLAKITGGRGFVHFTDRLGDGSFDPSDITGLVVGNGFSGTFSRTIHGSVVAGLTFDGIFDFFAERNNIAGLTVHGGVDGDILASGSISHVTVDDPTGFAHSGIRAIRAGSAAEGEFSLDGGTTLQTTGLPATLGRLTGADISMVRVAGGVAGISAGHGYGGGRGGNIADVIIGRTAGTVVEAGHALTDGALPAGAGGVGGSVSKLQVLGAQDGAEIIVAGGMGGVGLASSGAGGSVTELDFQLDAARLGNLLIVGGGGGNADGAETTGAAGGRGGNVAKVSIQTLQLDPVGTNIVVQGGAGGGGDLLFIEAVTREKEVKVVDPDGFGFHYEYVTVVVSPAIHRAGAGGAGGAVSDLAIEILSGDRIGTAEVEVRGGDGGQSPGKNGGVGGAVARAVIDGAAGLRIYGGNGGEALEGAGGAGGSLSTLSLECPSFARVDVAAGAGAGGGLAGGHGGSVVGLKATGERVLSFGVAAGPGGGADIASLAGKGGGGGSVASVAVRVSSIEDLGIASGSGGGGGGRTITHPVTGVETEQGGAGGAAGSVANVTIEALDGTADSRGGVQGGTGGGGMVKRPGGDGGSIRQLTVRGVADVFISGGAGGDGNNTSGGGAGGSVAQVVMSGFTFATFSGGSGGSGNFVSGAGGVGGSVEMLDLRGGALVNGGLSIEGGAGGDTGPGVRGGSGGGIAKVHAQLEGGSLTFYGGNASGGLGGSITDIAIIATGSDRPGYALFAGIGAAGAAGGTVARVQMRHVGDLQFFFAVSGSGGDSPDARGGRGGDVASLLVDVAGKIVTSAVVVGGDGGPGTTQGAGGWLRGVRVKAGTPFAFTHNPGAGEPNGKESGVIALP